MNYWSEELACGITEIDKQHKDICNTAYKLFNAYLEGRMHEEIIEAMQFLEDYIAEHYSCEENIMRQLNYPKYTEHKEKHHQFCRDYHNLKSKYLETQQITEIFIKDFNALVILWMISHYKEDDIELAKFIRDNHNESSCIVCNSYNESKCCKNNYFEAALKTNS